MNIVVQKYYQKVNNLILQKRVPEAKKKLLTLPVRVYDQMCNLACTDTKINKMFEKIEQLNRVQYLLYQKRNKISFNYLKEEQ